VGYVVLPYFVAVAGLLASALRIFRASIRRACFGLPKWLYAKSIRFILRLWFWNLSLNHRPAWRELHASPLSPTQ